MLQARAFEAEFLKRLDRLVLGIKRARTRRAGERALGRERGGGIELENFRDYSVGDDLRFLDWNAFARLDDLMMRTYKPQREVEISVVIDASASMGLPAADDKLGLAAAIGAAIAYVAMADHDAVRLAAFSSDRDAPRLQLTPRRRRRELYGEFRPFVMGLRAAGQTRLGAAIDQLLQARRSPGIAVVISDFLVSQTEAEAALASLVAARHEVKVIHVQGERERSGAYPPGYYRLRDCETGQMREIVFGPQAEQACRTRAAEIAGRLRAFCTDRGITYAAAFGADHLDEIIAREFPLLGVVR